MDDSGKTAPLVATPAPYFTPRISPNGRLLALSQDTANGRDVYVYDIARSTTSRLTFDGHGNRNPVWTPDGRHVVYASGDGKAISWIRADGSGEPLRLMQSSNTLVPWSFSPDGRRLSYTEITPDTQADLWILPVDARDPDRPAPGNPEVFLKTPASEGIGVAFSSDGRWIAYMSDESGRGEVYVRPSQRAESGKWQLSTSGGQYPLWSGNGRTLFYVAQDERIMAVEFSTQGGIFIPGAPRLWSQTPVRPMTRSITPGMQPLDLAPDGRRFAVLPRDEPADEKGSVHGTFLINMFVERHR
jgi:serine/threonine-protein kinase